MQYQQAVDAAMGGSVGLFVNWVSSGNCVANANILRRAVPSADLVVVPPPVGSQQGFVSSGLPITGNVMITKNCKDPEAAMKFLNYTMGTDEGYLLSRFGQEGVDYTWVDQSKGLLFKDDTDTSKYFYVYQDAYLNYFNNKYTNGKEPIPNVMADQSYYPSKPPVDMFVTYDPSKYSVADKLNSLATLIAQAKYKIIMGQDSPSSWDSVITDWLSKGGQQMIDDMTAQYNTQKTS